MTLRHAFDALRDNNLRVVLSTAGLASSLRKPPYSGALMATQTTFTSGRFALDVDGFRVDELKRFSGLDAQADIAANDIGATGTQKKHVTNTGWTPGQATTGIGMGKGMYG